MTKGPNYIYECPVCSSLLYRESLESGNTFRAIQYSDTKVIAPMLPDLPNLTKCNKCDSIFWLYKLKEIGKVECHDFKKSSWGEAYKAQFLDIDDYFRALDECKAENQEDQLVIRHAIWWAYNDRIRESQKMFINKKDELRWKENVIKLIDLLDYSDLNIRIIIAEMYRNIGNFKLCLKILKTIDDPNLIWYKEQIENHCNQKNRWVFELN